MRAQEAVTFLNISATTAQFVLSGGQYKFSVTATFGGGSVGFEQLGPDGVTWLPVITAVTANNTTTVNIPPGQFRFPIATATAVYVNIVRIPGE
jgi:hypothetical protein